MAILILVVQPLSVGHQETKESVRKVAQHDSTQQVRKQHSSMDSAWVSILPSLSNELWYARIILDFFSAQLAFGHRIITVIKAD